MYNRIPLALSLSIAACCYKITLLDIRQRLNFQQPRYLQASFLSANVPIMLILTWKIYLSQATMWSGGIFLLLPPAKTAAPVVSQLPGGKNSPMLQRD